MDILGPKLHPIFRGPADGLNFSGRPELVNRRCGELEMDALECMEAYGAIRGRKVCHTFIDDFTECVKIYMQTARVTQMKIERTKQLMRGERKASEFYDNIRPPRDGFQDGPFYN